jgi:hypothetical protein
MSYQHAITPNGRSLSNLISESAVQLRVDPSHWPDGLSESDAGVSAVRRTFEYARTAFEEFQNVRKSAVSDASLTDIGKREAIARWAEPK